MEVKTINGYTIKDEESRNGFLRLSEKFNQVKYIFPKNIISSYSGDCNIIKAYDKNIMIDTHTPEAKLDIYQMLEDNNI